MTINVFTALDDIINFRAKIIFTFEYLNPISIDVSATGTGSTIVPSIPMTNLNMGCIFTEQTSHSSVSKFSICAIVHDPKFSGKTTVSNSVSKFLGNVPIIVLKDIRKDIMKNPEATQADYVSTFSEVISSPQCSDGFVIDGLDALSEHVESDQFYLHCMKTKGIWDEVAKNPFTNNQHQFLTAYEQALAYVLA